jgi:phenylpropionate dioxygenase-like ring-hydroxylating dioxygenase large terminal subunit
VGSLFVFFFDCEGRENIVLVTQIPLLRRFWYCVAPSSALTDRPLPFRLLAEPIVLWRDADGTPHAVKDRCQHRTAKLSQGWVNGDNIVCPYHGWEYDGAGACVHIPQDANDDRTIGVPGYHCAERYNHLWVALEDPIFDLPAIPEFGVSGYRQVIEFYEPWATHPLRIMENAFDAAHLTFVHRKSFGMPDPSVVPMQIEELPDGFTSRNEVDVKTPEHMKAALSTTEDRTVRRMTSRFFLPFSRTVKIAYPSGLENILCTFLAPIDDSHTQFTQWVIRNDTASQVAPESVIAFDRQVTLEDRTVLEGTDGAFAIVPSEGDEVHMASDRPGLLMRKMLNRLIRSHGGASQRDAALAIR